MLIILMPSPCSTGTAPKQVSKKHPDQVNNDLMKEPTPALLPDISGVHWHVYAINYLQPSNFFHFSFFIQMPPQQLLLVHPCHHLRQTFGTGLVMHVTSLFGIPPLS